METSAKKAIYLFTLKWLPVLGTFLISIHYLLGFFDICTPIMDYVTECSLFAWIFLYSASLLFFCRLHRCFVYYVGAASLDVDTRHWLHWETDPSYIIPAIMVVVGLTLVIIALHRKFIIGCNAE